jgi:hypothetical protein
MNFSGSTLRAILFFGMIFHGDAFMQQPSNHHTVAMNGGLLNEDLASTIERQIEYQPAAANSDFAKRFAHLKGAKVPTVGEAFADFTSKMDQPINALYKGAITDIVGTTHLITVNARFQRDAIWSLGMLSSLDLILKNYPEKDNAKKIMNALFECVGMTEEELNAEAQTIIEWAAGKTMDDVTAAMRGEGTYFTKSHIKFEITISNSCVCKM